ncbi:hypothetical protein EHS25_004651 [Saitozyma podzolica]|uniref:Meiotic nuclear division protein 1 n=1 Tax=Saitozyma podzolica TaxID=1890683 RepID=A0A427YV14_9TREE|nr:hypothetical protein EHS25_004651 [Saitozyma podzolica]
MAPRGLSAAEKKVKMLEIFHETAEFFTLKELEKVAPKNKGIISQSVKDVLQELMDDGLVCFDKIGTSNYFWSFPSAAGAIKEAAVDKARKELDTLSTKITETSAALGDAAKGREETNDRRKLLASLSEEQSTSDSLRSELAAFTAADPAMYDRKRLAGGVCKDAAYRWTDNTIILLQFACSLGADETELRQHLNIGEEWEDLK